MDDIRPPKVPKQPSRPLRQAAKRPRNVAKTAAPRTLPVVKPLPPSRPDMQVDKTSEEAARPAEQKKSHKKRWFWISIVGALLLLVLGTTAALWWYNDALKPRSSAASRVRIVIESGATAEHIAQELEQKGIIKSSLAFQIYVKQQGKSGLQAGSYLFTPTQPVAEIVDWLTKGKTDAYYSTILPGKTLKEIKEKLVKDGFDVAAIDAAFAKTYDHPLLKSKPEGISLEGYVFPETYEVTSETTVEELLVKTFDELYRRIQEKGLEPALAARGYTLHQGLTLASLVQLEVATDSDRRQVAQVFASRLQQNMPLGSDVTYLYAASLLGQAPSIDIDSPYNTRKYPGLPPGPVANFNLPALEAVANPAPGDYLYFVAGDDGVTHFARTLEEHTANIKNYCSQLCNQE